MLNFAINSNLRLYTKVIFAPCSQDNVGVFDTADNTFITIATSGKVVGDSKYAGAVAVGVMVFFAPSNEDNVDESYYCYTGGSNIGVFDTARNVFSTIAVASSVLECGYYCDYKYEGATAVSTAAGTKVGRCMLDP